MSALTVLAPGVMRLEGCKVVEYAPPVSGKALGGRVWCKGRAASASSRALVFRPPKRRPHRHLRRPSAPVPYLPEIEIDGGGSGAIEGRGARGARGGAAGSRSVASLAGARALRLLDLVQQRATPFCALRTRSPNLNLKSQLTPNAR